MTEVQVITSTNKVKHKLRGVEAMAGQACGPCWYEWLASTSVVPLTYHTRAGPILIAETKINMEITCKKKK